MCCSVVVEWVCVATGDASTRPFIKCTIYSATRPSRADTDLLVYSAEHTSFIGTIPRHVVMRTLAPITLPPAADDSRAGRDVAVRQLQRITQLARERAIEGDSIHCHSHSIGQQCSQCTHCLLVIDRNNGSRSIGQTNTTLQYGIHSHRTGSGSSSSGHSSGSGGRGRTTEVQEVG